MLLLLSGSVLSGCEPAPLPVCELEPHIEENVSAGARDCGRWERDAVGMTAAVDCAVAAMDAGEMFFFRVDGIQSVPGHWGPTGESYAVSEVFGGSAEGGWHLFYDAPLGGRVLKFRCGGWEVTEHDQPQPQKMLRCVEPTGNQELCNHTWEHQERGKRYPEP